MTADTKDEVEEKRIGKEPIRETFRRMVRVYGSILRMAWDIARGRSAAILACMVLLGLSGAVQGLLTKSVIDALTDARAAAAFRWGLFLVSAAIITTLVTDLLSLLQADMGDRITQEVDHRVMAICATAPGLDHLERPEFADKIKIVRDHSYVPFAALANLNAVMYIIFGLGSAVILLGLIHPVLMLIPVVAIPSGAIQFLAMRKHMKLFDEVAPEDRLAKHYLDLATETKSAKEVRIFGLGDELLKRYRKLTYEYNRKLIRDRMKRSAVGIVSGAAYGLAMAGSIGFIGWLAMRGRATAGDVALGVMVTRQAIGHVEMAAGMVTWLAELAFTGERYLWMLDYRTDVRVLDPENPMPAPTAIVRGVTFDAVSFAYPGTDKKVLDRVSLFIPSGSTVALVGENGAGKSTMVKLLCRFYDATEGTISIDDLDIREFDPDAWREGIAASFQDFMRYQLIAREAVGVGDLPAVEEVERVGAAATFAGADRIIERLPSGLETQLGREFKDGIDLSEGEWQRVALARGAMRTLPYLVVLDEPTASLDARAENEVFQRFSELARPDDVFHPVTLLVSHRFSTVRMADLIVVMHEGKIEELGSHDELLAAGARYAELFRLQASRYD